LVGYVSMSYPIVGNFLKLLAGVSNSIFTW